MCGSELNDSVCVCQPRSHGADCVQSLRCAHSVHRAVTSDNSCLRNLSHLCLTSPSLTLGHVSPKSAKYLFSLVSLVSHWPWIQEWWVVTLKPVKPILRAQEGDIFIWYTSALWMRDEGWGTKLSDKKNGCSFGNQYFPVKSTLIKSNFWSHASLHIFSYPTTGPLQFMSVLYQFYRAFRLKHSLLLCENSCKSNS